MGKVEFALGCLLAVALISFVLSTLAWCFVNALAKDVADHETP